MPTVAALGASLRIGATLGVDSLDDLPSAESDLAAGVNASMSYGGFPETAPNVAPVVGRSAPLISLRAV